MAVVEEVADGVAAPLIIQAMETTVLNSMNAVLMVATVDEVVGDLLVVVEVEEIIMPATGRTVFIMLVLVILTSKRNCSAHLKIKKVPIQVLTLTSMIIFLSKPLVEMFLLLSKRYIYI